MVSHASYRVRGTHGVSRWLLIQIWALSLLNIDLFLIVQARRGRKGTQTLDTFLVYDVALAVLARVINRFHIVLVDRLLTVVMAELAVESTRVTHYRILLPAGPLSLLPPMLHLLEHLPRQAPAVT